MNRCRGLMALFLSGVSLAALAADPPPLRQPHPLAPHPRGTITEIVFSKSKPTAEQLRFRDQCWEERNRAVEKALRAATDAEWIRLVDEANETFLRKLQAAWGFPDEAFRRPRALIHRKSAPVYTAAERLLDKPLRPVQRDQVLTALADWLDVVVRAENQPGPEAKADVTQATFELLRRVGAILHLSEDQAVQFRNLAGL